MESRQIQINVELKNVVCRYYKIIYSKLFLTSQDFNFIPCKPNGTGDQVRNLYGMKSKISIGGFNVVFSGIIWFVCCGFEWNWFGSKTQ